MIWSGEITGLNIPQDCGNEGSESLVNTRHVCAIYTSETQTQSEDISLL